MSSIFRQIYDGEYISLCLLYITAYTVYGGHIYPLLPHSSRHQYPVVLVFQQPQGVEVNMRGSTLAYAMIIMSLGILAATFECRRLEDGGRSDHTNANPRANLVNSTTLHQSKVVLKPCTRNACDNKICFCCQNLPGLPCFPERDDCLAKCPLCDPKCPPSLET